MHSELILKVFEEKMDIEYYQINIICYSYEICCFRKKEFGIINAFYIIVVTISINIF